LRGTIGIFRAVAAGYAPFYLETSLDETQLAQARQALELILKPQEPFGAIVFESLWDIVMANAAYLRSPNCCSAQAVGPSPR